MRRDDVSNVLEVVLALLRELGAEADDLGHFDAAGTLDAWRHLDDRVHVFVARDADGSIAGVLTMCEGFAIYANGLFGVINEMYVMPRHRSRGVGKMLLDEAKALARQLGWKRIDVTAPESSAWSRTRAFYEREGFTFAGPKLKFKVGT